MGYDCVLIPGARKTDLSPLGDAINASMFCGQEKGLATAKGGDAGPKTICSKSFCTCYTYSYQHRTKYFNYILSATSIFTFQQSKYRSLQHLFRITLRWKKRQKMLIVLQSRPDLNLRTLCQHVDIKNYKSYSPLVSSG